MKIKNLKLKIYNLLAPFSIILFAVLLRLLPHPANVTPVAAIALFGGACLSKKYALVVPLIVMFISDSFLGFHNTMIFVYGSFFITGLIGFWLRENKTIRNIIISSFMSSILFFLITNFGVWLVGGLYSKTFEGLLQSYVMAIPFFQNTIIGDFFYSALLFGSYELLINNFKKPAVSI